MGKRGATPPPAAAAGGINDFLSVFASFGMEGISFPYYKQEGTAKASTPYLEIIIVFAFVMFVLEFYLDIRQYRALQKTEIPESLTSILKELDSKKKDTTTDSSTSLLARLTSKFDAARRYSIDKAHLGFVMSIFAQIEEVSMLLLGSMPFFWDLATKLTVKWLGGAKGENEYIVSLVFLGLNILLENIIQLPFSLWSTFVVEARHGFNKQTLGLFFLDKVKALILSAILGGPMICAVLYVIKAGGPNFFLYLYLLMLGFQMLLLTIYPTVIAPLFNKYEPLVDATLKEKIDELADKVKFPLTKVFVVDGSRRSAHSNAYFYGFFKNKRIVLFDTLISQVETNELLSILAHELGHWAKSHTLQMFLASQIHLFLAFYVFSSSLNNGDLYASFGFSARPTLIGLFLFFQAIWSPIDKALSLAITLWTRKNEFEADAYAVDLGYAEELQRGLVKLQIENLSNPNPDPYYSWYHYSHPPLKERLAAIHARVKGDKKRA